MSEVIVITSGKGGVGKTTTVANIGTGLAAMGKRVAVRYRYRTPKSGCCHGTGEPYCL